MKSLEEKLNHLRKEAASRKIKIMILGLGSVGMYLLDYLMSAGDSDVEICVAGRNEEKMRSDVNIIRVASLIRGQNRAEITVAGNVDFDDAASIADCLREFQPDIMVNSSRVYSGLKYGSISWNNIRAYGIWAPLAIPWLKSAGKAYPDFGSGNINHLIPRIRFSVAKQFDIEDYWNIDITYATSHFHDVVISKEGQTEGVEQLISISYQGKKLDADLDKTFSECRIPMPVDGKRNMMNASSNFEIIQGILSAVRGREKVKLHCPGAFGEIGGYPVILDGTCDEVRAFFDESAFGIDAMRRKNRESIDLDGIEDVADGVLYYTDELLRKVKKAFGVELVKKVSLEESEKVAEFLIAEIIEKNKA